MPVTIRPHLTGFAAGVIATLVCSALLTVVWAQPSKEVIVACADEDGTLRLAQPSAPCPPGQRRVVLKMPEPEEEDDEETPDDGRVDELDGRLRDLEERQLRGQLTPTKVVAPFEVVNENGQRVFLVDEGRMSLFNASGTNVIRVIANENGGYLQALSATSALSTTIGASGERVGVLVQESDKDRVDLGRGKLGTYSLRFLKAEGRLIAGIGQSPEGSGTAIVADANGRPRARMWVAPGRNAGTVDILNESDKAVASLTAGEGGNGRFELTNAGGELMVVAGVTEAGVGVVRAGPFVFNSGVMFLGLPGSYIAGKAK